MSGRLRVRFGPADNTVRVGDELYFRIERDSGVSVIRSRCPHRGGPLHLGTVSAEGGAERLRCPWHGTEFPLARLCARGVPTVQAGGEVHAYPPAAPGDSAHSAHQIVLAK
ncbi:Rieske 2Fe-2S domain-containing protein [Nocardiopsis sp. CNT-189]|uniref:Rieske 2Fe-2S domain-containing protein n=1 Tax=Nocardiopsis oceanisediminis TaxID=2816862 RepID=UPI003B38D8C1